MMFMSSSSCQLLLIIFPMISTTVKTPHTHTRAQCRRSVYVASVPLQSFLKVSKLSVFDLVLLNQNVFIINNKSNLGLLWISRKFSDCLKFSAFCYVWNWSRGLFFIFYFSSLICTQQQTLLIYYHYYYYLVKSPLAAVTASILLWNHISFLLEVGPVLLVEYFMLVWLGSVSAQTFLFF